VLENSIDASYKRNLKANTYDYLSPVFTRISGYTPEEMKALPNDGVLNLIHRDDLPEVNRVISESMSGTVGTTYQLEYRFRHKKRGYVWLQDRFITMGDAEGNITVSDKGSIVSVFTLPQENIQCLNHRSGERITGLLCVGLHPFG